MNILYAATGSVASRLVPKLQTELKKFGQVQTILTLSAKAFAAERGALENTLTDEDEMALYKKEGRVLHIDLRTWADVFIIAPLSGNTLAKIAGGFSDNLLTCVVRAWDYRQPLIIAPAMNPLMWEHPITQEHLNKLKSWGATIIPPQSKTLVCGETGIGALAEIKDILEPLHLINT